MILLDNEDISIDIDPTNCILIKHKRSIVQIAIVPAGFDLVLGYFGSKSENETLQTLRIKP